MKGKQVSSAGPMILLGVILLLGYGCGGGGGGGDAPGGGGGGGDTPEPTINRFFSNPTDNRLFAITDEDDGSTVTYLGDVDGDGQITRLTGVIVEDLEIEGDLVYILDDNGITTVHTPESTFEFEQISDSSTRLTAISKTGELRASIPLDLVADTQTSTFDRFTSGFSSKTVGTAAHSSAANMHVTITQCGKPVQNALVSANIFPAIGTNDPIGTPLGGGRYAFYIPYTVDPMLDLIKDCNKIPKIIENFCSYSWAISTFIKDDTTCESLQMAVNKIPLVSNSIKSQITKYCRPALIKHLPKVSDYVCNGKNVAEEIKNACKWEVILNEASKNHTFSLTVRIPGSAPFTTQSTPFSPNEPSQWELEAPTGISLEAFYILPAHPKNTEWYDAYASMVCPDPDNGTLVTLSATGTEWKGSSIAERMTENSTMNLAIPGVQDPETEVTDTITVSAEGKNWTMVVNRKAGKNGGTEVETEKYHVFKRSELGYKKGFSCVTRIEGYDYFYQKALPSKVNEIIAEKGDFKSFNDIACKGSPWAGPSPSFPAIWTDTAAVVLVGSFDKFEEIDPYRCETSQYDHRSVICTKWVHDLVCTPDPKFETYWKGIDSICGLPRKY